MKAITMSRLERGAAIRAIAFCDQWEKAVLDGHGQVVMEKLKAEFQDWLDEMDSMDALTAIRCIRAYANEVLSEETHE